MKITKNPNKLSIFEQNKIKANDGCDRCPVCGETRQWFFDGERSYGISDGIYREFHKGFFFIKSIRVNCYHCDTCGAEWESEPYQWC